MRIAITGSRGRVGRGVVAFALEQGHSVVSIEHSAPTGDEELSELTRLQVEVTDYTQVEQALKGCDALIHLAAIPSPRVHPDHEVHNNNVVGSYNALLAATRTGIKRICLASSVNAVGAAFSRWPRYDYFPLDEQHPSYNEDPYSLSKWIGEIQADSFARRDAYLTIASLRLHWTIAELPQAPRDEGFIERHVRDLWGYTRLDAAARACLLAITADFKGHEVFYIVAPHTLLATPSLELKQRFFPAVPLRDDLSGTRGFFDCDKALRVLGWMHDE